jgi:hypothetical protein
MSLHRALAATLLSAVSTFSIVTASGCGTSAVGVDDCRDIEQARCEAGLPCGLIDDVAACKRYYRDHCLHGLSGPSEAAASVADCVAVIKAAGTCAEADPNIALVDCDPSVTRPQNRLTHACDVVEHPERSLECAFLGDVDVGAGGQPATGGTGSTDEPDTTAAGVAGQTSSGGAAVE